MPPLLPYPSLRSAHPSFSRGFVVSSSVKSIPRVNGWVCTSLLSSLNAGVSQLARAVILKSTAGWLVEAQFSRSFPEAA